MATELYDLIRNRGRDVHHLRNALLGEAGSLVWYHRLDVARRRAALEAELADVEAEIERLAAELPALKKARDEAKARLDDVRARGGVEAAAVGTAHGIWVDRGGEMNAVAGPLSSARRKRLQLKGELERLGEIERPATPTLDALIEALQK
jgi:chromosome segregation ATPase